MARSKPNVRMDKFLGRTVVARAMALRERAIVTLGVVLRKRSIRKLDESTA